MWHLAQAASLECCAISCRSVSPWGTVSARSGTFFGGFGSFSPRSTSLSQLPRRIGLVRDAPDCVASADASPRMPPRPCFRTPSTRRHCEPSTLGME